MEKSVFMCILDRLDEPNQRRAKHNAECEDLFDKIAFNK